MQHYFVILHIHPLLNHLIFNISEVSFDPCIVHLVNLIRPHSLSELISSLLIFCDKHDARCLLVESVHALQPLVPPLLFQYSNDRIMLVIATLMHRHRRRLIDRNQIVVLVQNLNLCVIDRCLVSQQGMHDSIVVSQDIFRMHFLLVHCDPSI